MRVSYHLLLWRAAILLPLLVGCGGNDVMSPAATAKARRRKPSLQATAGRRWQIETLKELTEVTNKYEAERAKRAAADKELEHLRTKAHVSTAKADQAMAALASSQKRTEELTAGLAAAAAQVDKLTRELASVKKDLADSRALLKKETARADWVGAKLQTEVHDHVKTHNKLAKLQIEIRK